LRHIELRAYDYSLTLPAFVLLLTLHKLQQIEEEAIGDAPIQITNSSSNSSNNKTESLLGPQPGWAAGWIVEVHSTEPVAVAETATRTDTASSAATAAAVTTTTYTVAIGENDSADKVVNSTNATAGGVMNAVSGKGSTTEGESNANEVVLVVSQHTCVHGHLTSAWCVALH
jgi:hypothetical protein